MAVFESIIGIVVVLAILVVGCGSLVKRRAFNQQTPDGDSFGNRLMGHGPNDEIFYPTWRDRVRIVRRWVNQHRHR